MSYQVIARKWRPQTFEEVVGQEAITRTLQNAIIDQRLHHAYIFAGPRGVGKTTTARLFARALNCIAGPTAQPCGQCPACVEIARGNSIDVLEIDAATHTQIDNVREVIINTIATTPARDRYKVFIIDEVHQLSLHSWNALLKTLEEPPAHVLFIMATTERHKVPDTILSRCQIFEFRLIAESKIFDRLRRIANEETITITDTGLHKIARAGEGSMRDAQSVFDQVISFAGHKISDEDVIKALGIVETELLVRTTEAIADGDNPKVLQLINELVERGYDLRSFCRELMTHFRNLLVLKSVGYDSELVTLSSAELESIRTLPQRFSEAELIRAFHLLTEVEQNLRYSTEPRFQLEIGLIRLAQAGRVKSVAELVARLEALEKRMRGEPAGRSDYPRATDAPPSPPPRVAEAPAPRSVRSTRQHSEPAASRQPESGRSQTNEPATGVAMAPVAGGKGLAERIKAELGDRGKMLLLGTLDQAQAIELVGDTLRVVLAGDGGLLKETLSEKPNAQLIEVIAGEITGGHVRLVIVTEGDAPQHKSAGEQEREQLRAEAERDATVRALLKTFKGELTEIVPKE
jgi:DNA polymerase-3 subunit gamma/tau